MATWPTTPAEVRDFMDANCASAEYANEDGHPSEGDKYLLTAHDFLEAVRWWTMHDAPAKKVKPFPKKHMARLIKKLQNIEKDEQVYCRDLGGPAFPGSLHAGLVLDAISIRAAIAYITEAGAK